MGRVLDRLTTSTKAVLCTSLAALAISPLHAQQVTSVVNSASYTQDLGEGSIATIFGQNLAPTPCAASVVPFPKSLCGVTVAADGEQLPLLYAGPTQINVQLPYGTGKRNITVNNQGHASPAVPITVLDRAPGIFNYTLQGFPNMAAAQYEDYSVHSATNPLQLGKNALTLYLTGLGIPTNGEAPALGAPAPLDQLLNVQPVDVYVNNTKLPATDILFAGYAPSLIIHQVNILPESTLPTGANSIKVCAGTVCSPAVTVFMTNTNEYLVGTVSSPGVMSDGKNRPLESIVGTASSDAGIYGINVNHDGNYLVPARGTTNISLLANDNWESYKDTVIANGATIAPLIQAFPHVVYADVKGNYNRVDHTWSLVSYFYPPTQQWVGTQGGGDVTLFDMVHDLSTNGINPQCYETVNMWSRSDEPIKVYIDATGQPSFDAVTGVNTAISPSNNVVYGADLVWQTLQKSPQTGGTSFVRVDQPINIPAGEHGINISFVDVSQNAGAGGLTAAYPFATNTAACGPITAAETTIARNQGVSSSLIGVVEHEEGRETGDGTTYAPHGTSFSPFATDNLSAGGNDKLSVRDLDGRKMVEYLGYGEDLGKYAK